MTIPLVLMLAIILAISSLDYRVGAGVWYVVK